MPSEASAALADAFVVVPQLINIDRSSKREGINGHCSETCPEWSESTTLQELQPKRCQPSNPLRFGVWRW